MSANTQYLEIKRLEQQIAEIKAQRKAALKAFRGDLIICLETHRKLFFELIDSEKLYQDCGSDELIEVSSDATTLRATFGYSFRNEWNTYELGIPARYLMPGGQAEMEKDALALADAKEAQRKADALADSKERLQEYKRLGAEFGWTLRE